MSLHNDETNELFVEDTCIKPFELNNNKEEYNEDEAMSSLSNCTRPDHNLTIKIDPNVTTKPGPVITKPTRSREMTKM